ncbi:MAG: PepSY domain-containing protein [Cypionkella sp.]|jgi:uncharacterized membrane protein YkoI|nr:PepSY domain-containing protein [Cypionkella sp.]
MKNLASALLLSFVMLPVPVGSVASDFPDFELAEEAVKQGKILPLATILDRVAAVQPGQVIEVELEDDDGIQLYEVELITPDGRLLEVELDARTGDILSVDEDS